MLNTQEKEALYKSVDLAINAAERMKTIINMLSLKRQTVCQIFNESQQDANRDSNVEIDNLCGYLPRLNSFIEEVSVIKQIEDNIPDVLKTFLQKEFVEFHWDNVGSSSGYVKGKIAEFFAKQVSDSLVLAPEDAESVRLLRQLPRQYRNNVIEFERKIAQYKIFDKIKWIQNNIVMIGANGSGKSTFARQLKGKISSNVSILSAQHLLVYTKKNSIPSSEGEIQKIHNFQRNSKLSSDSNFSSLIGDDMNQLITTLIADYTDKAYKHYKGGVREESFLDKAVEIWEELLEHREMVIGRGFLEIKADIGIPYDFNNLSDGEKAVFYYIGHVLLVEENSYIIIDEPENHLNLAICNKLWDKLEAVRPDCKFIYLTHNLDFAVSRTDTTVIWNKKFIPPDIWDFEILESDETMPDSLLMEVLGSRKNICFCEGKDKSVLDYKLYSVLFPEYTVIPVGGHLDVISYTNAYNKSAVCSNNAIGIIDGDCHLEAQITKWKKQKIYTIPINEIENLLCDTLILEKAVSVFMSGSQALENYYDLFWKELERDKTLQTVWYINNVINNKFKDHFLHEKSDIENLKTELQSITSEEEIEQKYQERLLEINNLLEMKDYDAALKIVNFKGKLTKTIAKNSIVDKYPDRVIGLIKSDVELQLAIKQKYFNMIFAE